MSATYSIGTLSALTGLSQHTIRAWERRYGALAPTRGETNRRVYTESDVERLVLLRRAVETGHSIGHVANLPEVQLRHLLVGQRDSGAAGQNPRARAEAFLSDALQSIVQLDPEKLDRVLARGNAELGILELLEKLVIPLLSEIGARWHEGSLRISQEHMGTAVLRSFLQRVRHSIPALPNAPRLLVATPKDQHHDLGALMVSIVAAMEYWNVTYLGPNLPSGEIAAAARMSGAQAVGLSLVYPIDDPGLSDEFRNLRREIGSSLPILVGGSASSHYAAMLAENGAEICPDLESLRHTLRRIASVRQAS